MTGRRAKREEKIPFPLWALLFKEHLFLFTSMCVSEYACGCSRRPNEAIRSPGVVGGCELPSVSVENQTPVLYKSIDSHS